MKSFIEKTENIPEMPQVDVLVCGGGPAGAGAAIRAGRLGLKTMVIEMQDCLGGMATAGMMSNWSGAHSEVLTELLDRSHEKAKVMGPKEYRRLDEEPIYHEIQKIVLAEMAKEAGVEVLYYTIACDTVVEDGKVKGVIIQNKSGRKYIPAKCVIDSTGDGDIAYYAGVPYTMGRETDGKCQPCTLMFKVGGVDFKRAVFPPSFETLVDTPKGELQSLGKKNLPFPAGHVLLYKQPGEDTVCLNMTNVLDIDGTDAKSVSDGIAVCRSQIEPIIKFLREYAPGYENAWLMSCASLFGVRETRHFEGMSRMEIEDVTNANWHEDWAVKNAFFTIDIHNMTGSGLDETGCQEKFTQTKSYTIPYGCIVPKNVEGLLLSGRNISGSHLAHASFRVMGTCTALGEAAAAAAYLSIKNNCSLKNISVSELQNILNKLY